MVLLKRGIQSYHHKNKIKHAPNQKPVILKVYMVHQEQPSIDARQHERGRRCDARISIYVSRLR